MFLLFILVIITFEKYVQVKDLSINEESSNQTSFLFKLEHTLMNGYFIFDTKNIGNQQNNEVLFVIKDEVTNSHILEINKIQQKKINGTQKNVIVLDSILYSQNWYKLEVTPSQILIQQGNIIQFDVATQSQEIYIIQDFFIGKTNYYIKNSRQQNQIDVEALYFTKINKYGIGAHSAIKLYISLPDQLTLENSQLEMRLNYNFYNHTIYDNNRQYTFDFCWSNLDVYNCTFQDDQIRIFVSKFFRSNFEIIIDYKVGKWLQNSINFILDSINFEKQFHIVEFQDIKQDKRNQEVFINEEFIQNRLLQFEDDENINTENVEQVISEYINQIFGLNSSICENLAQNNSLYQFASNKIQNLTKTINTSLQINDELLQNQTNSNNSLNYSTQLSFSLDKSQSVNLNLINISSGEIMWYDIQPNDSYLTIQNQIQPYNSNLIDSYMDISQIIVWNGSFIFQNQSGLYQTSSLINYNTIEDYGQKIYSFDSCISLSVSVAGNYSNILTSICLKNLMYWITSYILPQTNYSQMIKNITQMFYQQLQFQKCYQNCSNSSNNVIFLDIKKTYQIQNYVFILGQTNDNNQTFPLYQIHILNFTNNGIYEFQTISCYDSPINNETILDKNITENDFNYSNVTDFNITILYNKSLEFNNTYSARGFVFFICSKPNQLRYYGFNFINTTNLTFNKNSQGFKYLGCLLFNKTVILQQIFVYMVQYDQIILILTTQSNYSAIFMMSYNPIEIEEINEILQFEKIIAMIPPYLNWTQKPQGVLNSKHLLLVYQNPIIDQYALAVYDMSQIMLKSAHNIQDDPNQYISYMQAGTQAINNTLFQTQMLEFSTETAVLLGFESLIMSLINCSNANTESSKISTFKYSNNLKIQVNLSDNNYKQSIYSFNLTGQNQYNQTSAILFFIPPKTPQSFSIIIVCVVFSIILGLGIAIIIYFKKYLNKLENKKIPSYFQEIELKE